MDITNLLLTISLTPDLRFAYPYDDEQAMTFTTEPFTARLLDPVLDTEFVVASVPFTRASKN